MIQAAEHLELFIENRHLVGRKAEKTITEYRRLIGSILPCADFYGAERPSLIDEALVKHGKNEGWSDRYIYKHSRVMLAYCRWLFAEGHTEKNAYPFSQIPKPKPSRPDFATPQIVEKILFDPFLTLQDKLLIDILWHTAVRREECSLLRQSDFHLGQSEDLATVWCDHISRHDAGQPWKLLHNGSLVDTDTAFCPRCAKSRPAERSGYVNVRAEISKGGYGAREIPFGTELGNAIKRHFEIVRAVSGDPEAVFINQYFKPMRDVDITARIRQIGDRTNPYRGPMHLTPKMFRHGRGVVWILNGVPAPVVMRWLGHNSMEMTTHYINMAADYAQKIHIKFNPDDYKMTA